MWLCSAQLVLVILLNWRAIIIVLDTLQNVVSGKTVCFDEFLLRTLGSQYMEGFQWQHSWVYD